ncbi:MAG TPA: TolC family protein [Blastocatellia bacterium]|nr:TolC family protein [Blastocatellia bacterium]
MRHLFFLTVLLSALMDPLIVVAEVPRAGAPGPGLYGLDDIVTLALERNPAVAAAGGGVNQRRGERVAAGAYLNPSIYGTAGSGAITDPRTGVVILERRVTIEQPLELPAKRRARMNAAEAQLAGAQAELQDTRLKVQSDAKVAFYQLLLAQRDLELSTQNLSITREIFQMIKARVDAGQARPFEAVKANVELQKAEKELSRAENMMAVARVRLDTLTAGALGKVFSVSGDFRSWREELNLDQLMAPALESHPRVLLPEKRREQAEHTIVQERESRIPYIAVSGTYNREAGNEDFLMGLRIPLPLWYRRQGEIEAALGARERAEAERRSAQNELVNAITQHGQEVRTAGQQIQVFEKGLLKQAEEALRIARLSFAQGAASILEVIDAQRVYRQVLLEYAQARADLSIALARLERWTGEPQ